MNQPLTLPITDQEIEQELLLITQPTLRAQLLRAQQFNKMSASCVIQRGDHVYLSLRDVADEAQRKEVAWAVSRLQMGAIIYPQTLPEPLKGVLLASMNLSPTESSPLLQSLIWGALTGVIGGVLVMALVGLIMMVLNAQTEYYVGIAATAVAFILSGTIIGCSTSIFFWRRLSN